MWITGEGILLTHLHPMKVQQHHTSSLEGQMVSPSLHLIQHDHPERPQVLFVHDPEVLEENWDGGTALLQIYNQNYEQFRCDAESTDMETLQTSFLGKITLKNLYNLIQLKVWNSKWPATTATLMCYF